MRTPIATREQDVPTTTVGVTTPVTYTVYETDTGYQLVVSSPDVPEVALMSSPSKHCVLSMGELTEGQGL